MSYLVLARKWRPQDFDALIGQEHVRQTLKNAILQNRLAHAFLFCGPRGVGKTSAARILAKILMCSKVKDAKPCNQCSVCDGIAKGTAIDVIEIDGASNNGVEAIRELRERAQYLPTQGQNKVYIIDEVHMLSQSAFNALLKILEEPPAHLKFIFATTEAHKIPVTILSRCQRFDFKKICLKQLSQHLAQVSEQEKIQVDAAALFKIAKEARGSFRDALSLLDQVRSFAGDAIYLKDIQEMLGAAQEEAYFEFIERIFKKEASSVLKLLFNFYDQGQDSKQIAAHLLDYVRMLMLVKISQETISAQALDISDGELATLVSLSKLVSLEELEWSFHILIQGMQQMSYTLYPQYVFEVTVVKLLHLKPLVVIEELIHKVEKLSRNFKGEPVASSVGASGTASVVMSLRSKEFLWEEFVSFIQSKKPSLAAILEHGYFVHFSNDQLVIGYAPESVFFKLVSSPENLSSLKKMAVDYVGRDISVMVNEMKSGNDIQHTSLIQKQESQQQSLKKKALENQWVKQTQDTFDAKIVEVKVDELSSKGEHE
ncbi:MAG: DNA polymerase III subunit gamma/tau [Deltaproteobacteria bacterium]|nr:DNA polymerase III subunit gamma/tau [Deltaproteobacteria bacterium]